MPNPTNYITPEKAFEFDKKNHKNHKSLAWWRKQASKRKKTCIVCSDKEWLYGACDMCFTCTTGEADPSNDYELKAK